MEEFKHVCKKVAFSDEKQAIFYIDKLKNTSKRETVPVRAYLCEFCFNWHLTSTRDLSQDNIQKRLDKALRDLSELQKENKELKVKINNQREHILGQMKCISSLKNSTYAQMYINHKKKTNE